MAMKRIMQKFSLISLAILFLFAGCEKDGKNGWLYSENESGNFHPVSNVKGETGWGYALLRWDLPQSVQTLTMIDVSWTDAEGVTDYKKMTHFEDSLWLALEGNDYMFRVTSLSTSGEAVTDSLLLKVPDWKAEPVALVQDVKVSVVANELFVTWTKNTHRAYAKSVFQVYDKEGNLIQTAERLKEESSSVKFSDLKYNTEYTLRYFSENLAGAASEQEETGFTTDLYAPDMPKIEVLDHAGETDFAGNKIVTTVYAYSTEIQWENIDSRMDSIAIKFVGLNNEDCEFKFRASEQKGYLTLLPGGTVTLSVRALIDGEWTGARGQEFATRNPEDTYVFRAPNSYDANSKIGQGFAQQTSLNNYTPAKAYSYKLLIEKCPEKYEIWMKPKMVDEVELFPTIKTLVIGNASQPVIHPDAGSGQMAPTLDEFKKLIPRLKKLQTIRIKKGFGGTSSITNKKYVDEFIEEFGNVEKYPGLTIETF